MLGKTVGTIFQVMKEEYERLEEALQLYTDQINALPRSKPRIKQIRGNEYVYLNRRDGAKVVDEYIGKAGSEQVTAVLALVEKRDRLIQLRKQTMEKLREVKKVLRGKI